MSDHSHWPLFVKQPLGGFDRRALVKVLAEQGPKVAAADLAAARAALRPQGVKLPADQVVLLLGGSNGVLRHVAVQLVFAEGAAVHAVHLDSEKLQIGGHHARAIAGASANRAVFDNRDATDPEVVADVVARLGATYRVVHLINGIAAGAPKRWAEQGPISVPELDLAFDPVRQIADFAHPESWRQLGQVRVDVASEADVERTNRAIGHSSALWAEALAGAGLLVPGESLVAFADYDFEPDDPVYGQGPLAGAKRLQRDSMLEIAHRHRVRTVRLCYPPMNTTALGAIPGGLLMFACTTELLLRRGSYERMAPLAEKTMAAFTTEARELRLDAHYKAVLGDLPAFLSALDPERFRNQFPHVQGAPTL